MTQEINNTGYWSGSTAHNYHIHSKELSDWICNFFTDKDEIIYDMGCGLGNYLQDLKIAGFKNLIGFEAEPPKNKVFDNIIEKNLVYPIAIQNNNKGSVISLEVGEHIPKKYMHIYIDNVCDHVKKYLITSWAIRGQPGHGHINCLNNNEIIPEYEKRGFKLLLKETEEARKIIKDYCYWFRNTLFILEKCEK